MLRRRSNFDRRNGQRRSGTRGLLSRCVTGDRGGRTSPVLHGFFRVFLPHPLPGRVHNSRARCHSENERRVIGPTEPERLYLNPVVDQCRTSGFEKRKVDLSPVLGPRIVGHSTFLCGLRFPSRVRAHLLKFVKHKDSNQQ